MNNDRGGNPSDRLWDGFRKQMADAFAKSLGVTTSQEMGTQAVRDPSDSPLMRLISHSSVITIMGHRGTGKSGLACGR